MKLFSKSSIQVKLLVLLVALPVLFLLIYLIFVFDLFKKDKIAYIYESGVSVSRTISAQVKSEIHSLTSEIKPILQGYDRASGKFDQLSNRLFKDSTTLKVLNVYQVQGSSFTHKGELKQHNIQDQRPFESSDLQTTRLTEVTLFDSKHENHLWLGLMDQKSSLLILALIKSEDLISVFATEGLYSNYLIKESGSPLFQDKGVKKYSTFDNWNFKQEENRFAWQEGSFETLSPDGIPMLLSYSRVGFGDLLVISLIDMDKAQSAIKILLQKSILFFISLISLAVIVSFYTSKKATMSLRELSSATDEIAKGNFKINLIQRTQDEVGKLAARFNEMASRIVVLMGETAEKARMETELKTAQTVQETLFPNPNVSIGDINISGYYTPASECGGDWWSYNEVGDNIYFWIGDATGHGASAALITSAAKASVEIISELKPEGPARALYLLNKAIYNTSKGKICMTFFVGVINKKTKTLTYANSGHEPPLLINRGDAPIKPKSMNPLLEANGPRLGDQEHSEYTEKSISLKQGDLILVYTDGVVDMANPSDKTWGERKFLQAFADATNEGLDSESIVKKIKRDAETFRLDAPLKDDITFFVCEVV